MSKGAFPFATNNVYANISKPPLDIAGLYTSPYTCPTRFATSRFNVYTERSHFLHAPVHGNKLRAGERHMRSDDCMYCTKRIVSLHVADPTIFDEWRGIDTVRPAVVFHEDEELF